MAPVLTLPEYLAGLARKKFEYGVTDCLMILADWVIIRRGVDPAAAWRGKYHDEASCRAALVAGGGLVRCIEIGIAPLGIPRTNEPKRGDFALVSAPVMRGNTRVLRRAGGLCVSEHRWAVMSDTGLLIADFRPVTAWAL